MSLNLSDILFAYQNLIAFSQLNNHDTWPRIILSKLTKILITATSAIYQRCLFKKQKNKRNLTPFYKYMNIKLDYSMTFMIVLYLWDLMGMNVVWMLFEWWNLKNYFVLSRVSDLTSLTISQSALPTFKMEATIADNVESLLTCSLLNNISSQHTCL